MKPRSAYPAQASRRRAAPRRTVHRLHTVLLALLCGVLLAGGAAPLLAAGGSYATTGTGTYAQSLWWLDFTSFNTGSSATQPLSFTLPNGAGTFNMSAQATSGMAVVAEPSWSGGGAFGHGAYNGITGKPNFYWLSQTGVGTTTLSSLSVKDASGNSRSFVLYSADGENTNAPETITYTSTSSWSLIDNVTYYASFNGGAVTLTGTGTGTVLESAPPANDNNYNGSVVLGTANPTQVSTAYSGNEATLFAVSLPPLTFNLVINGRVSASDEFTASIAYTSPGGHHQDRDHRRGRQRRYRGDFGHRHQQHHALRRHGGGELLDPLCLHRQHELQQQRTGSGELRRHQHRAAERGRHQLRAHPADRGRHHLHTHPDAAAADGCGTVYDDANHNGALDAGESGTGVAGLYVKLAPYSAGACQSPATAAAAVNAASGAYSFAPMPAGSYCLILNAGQYAHRHHRRAPRRLDRHAERERHHPAQRGAERATAAAGLRPVRRQQRERHGVWRHGRWRRHCQQRRQDGSEAGLGSVLVQGSGAVTTAMRTPASGAYTLWIPAGSSGALTITPLAPSGYLATGGSPGTSGGSYSRPSITFTPVAGHAYTGVSFGLIPPNSLAPNGAQQVQPGATVAYAHTFIAGSAGQVSFAIAASSTPASPAWTTVLYQDVSCSGTLTAGDPQISAPVAVTAGQKVCLIVKVQVPAGAAAGAQDALTLSAACQYSNANPALAATVSVGDVTTVGSAGTLSLTKLVANLTQGGGAATSGNANPGDTLQYTLTATNTGAQAVSTLVINDATPAFTTFVSAACPGTLPAGVSSCTLTAQPAAGATGAVQWTFGGSLASGAALVVTYQVKIGS